MLIIYVALAYAIFVCTRADYTRCSLYKSSALPTETTDAPKLHFYNLDEEVSGVKESRLLSKLEEQIVENAEAFRCVEEFTIQYGLESNSLSVCLEYVWRTKLCMTHGYVTTVKFNYYDLDEKEVRFYGRILVIRVFFKEHGGGHKKGIVDLPVFGAYNGEKINKKLNQYLLLLISQRGLGRTNHVFEWVKSALAVPTPQLRQECTNIGRKRDTYYANCQYVSGDTLDNILELFGWS